MRIIGEAIRAVLVSLGVLAAAASAKAPGPGETRCVTSYGVTDCKSGPPLAPVQPMPLYVAPAPPPPTPERKIVTGAAAVFCTLMAGRPDLGACYFDENDCKAAVPTFAANGTGYSECAEHASASCFNMVRVLDGERKISCAPSITSCEATLNMVRGNPDFTVAQTQCGIYRQVQP